MKGDPEKHGCKIAFVVIWGEFDICLFVKAYSSAIGNIAVSKKKVCLQILELHSVTFLVKVKTWSVFSIQKSRVTSFES